MPFIPLEVFANQPSTTVSTGGQTAPAQGTQETWTVASATAFPVVKYGAQQFHIVDANQGFISEIITVAATSGTSWTVIRGAEGTTPVPHTAGFTVVQVVTAAGLAQMQYPPWQFAVQAYGAEGDGKIGTGGTGTSGTATFTDAGASFVNAVAPAGDVGKCIIINQGAGGSATNPFVGTISAVNSATSVTLSANLAANASAAPYIYGTDDTAAINAAVSAAASWAVSTGNYKAQVVFEPQNYMLAGLTQQVSPRVNTQIPVPYGTQYGRKLIIDFIGVGDASEPDYWESTIPSLQGTCLVSALWCTQVDPTYGAQSVIGGPNATTGLTPGGFANVLVNIVGITIVCPWNSSQCGFDFSWCAQANLPDASYLAFAAVNYNAQTLGGPYLAQNNVPANGNSIGLVMPLIANNDNCNIGFYTAEGAAIGIQIAEHTTAQRLALVYCYICIYPAFAGGGNYSHGASILYASTEASTYCISTISQSGGFFSIFIGMLDRETLTTNDIYDPNNCLLGEVLLATAGIGAGLQPSIVGAANLRVISTANPRGPWSGAPAAPSSATAQQNISWRDATIYASAVTSITGVSVGPASGSLTALGLTGGAGVKVPIRVPSGHWYSVTYSGTLTTTWVLD